ncbi:MAG: putative rane protein [Actinomycetota bacterium]|nr:putative rane protein [Actinomycetota bacterium]
MLVGLMVVGYISLLRYEGPRRVPEGTPVATTLQKWCWFVGTFFLWLGADYPIHDIAEKYLFSIHMVQHMIFSFVAAPLLLAGLPAWAIRMVLKPPKVMRFVRRLTRPLVAFAIFNVVIAFTHWPAVVDAAVQSEWLHFSLHFVLFFSSVLMWWPVLDPLPETRRLSEPGKMLYLFGQSILPTVPASFLTFGDTPLYHFYEHVPRLWGIDALTDMRIAGLVMKIGGGLLLWTVIAIVFFKWNSDEESGKFDKSISWDDFEHELTALDLRRT